MENEIFVIYEAGILNAEDQKIHFILEEYLKLLGEDYIKSGKITESISCFYLTKRDNRFSHIGASCAFNYDKDNIQNIPYLSDCSLNDIGDIINYYYQRYGMDFFEKLGKYLNFSSVLFDEESKTFVAGVVNGRKSGFKLFKGFLENNRQVYSNSEDILNKICKMVIEVPDNSYITRDGIYPVTQSENEYTRKLWHKLEEFVEKDN